jgi:hypothetical protein
MMIHENKNGFSFTDMAFRSQRRIKKRPICFSYMPKCFKVFILDSEFWILFSYKEL